MQEDEPRAEPPTDWADLRAQADKLGITLSQFQQLQMQKKRRLANKALSSSRYVKKDPAPGQ